MKRRELLRTMAVGPLIPLAGLPEKDGYTVVRQAGNDKGSWDPWAEVNLSHVAWNVAQIKKAARVPLMAVVKANAYGHGLVEVSRFVEKNGISWLMTGKLEEAVSLRKAGVRCSILNFGPFSRVDCRELTGLNISQAVSTAEVAFLAEEAGRRKKQASVHIDIDTGMGRTGVLHEKAMPLIKKVASLFSLRIEGIATTLTEDAEFDRVQLARFKEVCSAAEKKGVHPGLKHAASSAGILSSPDFHLDIVRPGIMLYGYYPSPETQKEDRLSLRPALRLPAKVTEIRELVPGDTLSYHRVYVAKERMRVATVGIGYSDGYPPQLAGKSEVVILDRKYPVIAVVTSNHLIVDISKSADIKPGDDVILVDDNKESGLTADRVAESAGISVYKLLIGLNPQLPRFYRDKTD